jgi:tyrosine-protein phosphatase SIW14
MWDSRLSQYGEGWLLQLSKLAAWGMALTIATLMAGVPFVYYRYCYTYAKRLRPVAEGKVYRSGCMTADGLAETIERLHIRTVFNLMEDVPDPILSLGFFDTSTVREAELCQRLGAKMINLNVDVMAPNRVGKERPAAIWTFLEFMDNPATYPVLIHCKAGLHRTGIMVAVYRMEYDDWTPHEAMGELKANGFGEFAASAANAYVKQYILTYEPRRQLAGRQLIPGLALALPK